MSKFFRIVVITNFGVLAPLITWNLWTLENKFIFEGTHPMRVFVVVIVLTQVQVAKMPFGGYLIYFPQQIREIYQKKI